MVKKLNTQIGLIVLGTLFAIFAVSSVVPVYRAAAAPASITEKPVVDVKVNGSDGERSPIGSDKSLFVVPGVTYTVDWTSTGFGTCDTNQSIGSDPNWDPYDFRMPNGTYTGGPLPKEFGRHDYQIRCVNPLTNESSLDYVSVTTASTSPELVLGLAGTSRLSATINDGESVTLVWSAPEGHGIGLCRTFGTNGVGDGAVPNTGTKQVTPRFVPHGSFTSTSYVFSFRCEYNGVYYVYGEKSVFVIVKKVN